jgi:group I intron endonuclease
MTIGIYKIININNEKYYLGSSVNIEERWVRHKNDLKNKKHCNVLLQRALDKYGEASFKFEIIVQSNSWNESQLLVVEQTYLDNLIGENYNISKGASGGDNLTNHPNRDDIIARISAGGKNRYANISEEEKRKTSEAMMGANNHMYGGTHTEAAREKISISSKAYYSENDNYRKGKTYEELFGDTEAIRLKKILSDVASQRIGDKNPFYGKKHTEEFKLKTSEGKKGKYYGSQNNPIMIDNVRYDSAGQASKILNIPSVTIRWRCLSKNKKFQNYQILEEKE